MTDSSPVQNPNSWWGTFVGCFVGMTARDRRNARRAYQWMFIWLASFVAIALAMRFDLLAAGVVTWAAIGGSLVLGLVTMREMVRFLREADELLRKVYLEALALGFGAAMVANFTLALIERARDQPFEIGDLFLVMVIFFAIGLFGGTRRYR